MARESVFAKLNEPFDRPARQDATAIAGGGEKVSSLFLIETRLLREESRLLRAKLEFEQVALKKVREEAARLCKKSRALREMSRHVSRKY